MANTHRPSEKMLRQYYIPRINSLGKFLLLWASEHFELYSSDPWHYTQFNVECLMGFIDEMANYAARVDKESVEFWRQMKLVLSKAR